LVSFGALLIGLKPFTDEIGLGVMALGVAYLALTPGSLGPNNFGPEPAKVSGPQIALPALALFTPGSRLGLPIPEIFNLCAFPSHLQIVVAQSYASLGEAIFVDSEGAAFRGEHNQHGWRAVYEFTRIPAPEFSELKARVAAGYEAGLPWWDDDDGPMPPEHLALTKRTLASLKSAGGLADIFATFADD
jgi:hypothetical protein